MSRRTDRAVADLVHGLVITHDVRAGRHGEIPTRTYRASAADLGVTLVWLHGGAFSHGGLDQPESHAVAAAVAQSGITVVAVDYRRVPPWSWSRDAPPGRLPGIRYPIPLDDVIDVLTAAGIEAPVVVLGGASAGACLAAAASLRLVAEGCPVPSDLVLAYGTFHAQLPPINAELRSRIRGRHGLVQFRPTTVRRMNHNYAGSAEAMLDPYAFPGGHDLHGVPRALLLDADRDSLRASGESFATELAAAGTAVEHRVVAGSTHGFLNRPGSKEFDSGIRAIVTRLSSVAPHA